MGGRAVSNSYALRANYQRDRGPVAGASFEPASTMSVMSYSEELVSAALPALAAFEPAATPFQRPGPDVLSETIPVVFVGRNRDGLWVARDAEAKIGGMFWRKQAALDFAKAGAAASGCAIVFPQGRFELDMPNHGNPLLTFLAAARRLLARQTAATRKHLTF